MNRLMTVDGITFVYLGETAMVHGSYTKMEHCIGTTADFRGGTPLKQEVPWCLAKNKIQLEEASSSASPLKGPWPMSTFGLTSFRQVQSRVCQSLACQGWATCIGGPTSFMASKEKPQLSFHLLVIRSVREDPQTNCVESFQKMASSSRTVVIDPSPKWRPKLKKNYHMQRLPHSKKEDGQDSRYWKVQVNSTHVIGEMAVWNFWYIQTFVWLEV